VESAWKASVPREPGRDWRAILRACADREVDALYLVGVDPLRDVPDAALARSALENVSLRIVQGLELGSLEPFADVFLPATAFLEREGHLTTWEGRGQRLRRVRDPLGLSRPDWEIFASLALACGGDLGFETLDELHEEMGELLAPMDDREGESSAPGTSAPPAAELASTDGLTLFTYPLLIDDGRLSERAEQLKSALAEEPFVEIHPDDAGVAGLADGQEVTVATSAGSAALPARVTDRVAKGAVFVPFNQRGFQANRLLDGDFVTGVTLEAVEQPTEAQAAEA
jgi:formate dehydrogenase major subunit